MRSRRSSRHNRAFAPAIRTTLLVIASLCVAIDTRAATAQPIPRDRYHAHLTPAPPLVERAPASTRLHLYGDPTSLAFVDRDPVDGVDDRRGAHLMAIAEHFSPILRRNNDLVPLDVWSAIGDSARITVDTWRDDDPAGSSSFPFGTRPTNGGTRGNGNWVTADAALADAPLVALLDEFAPERRRPATEPPGPRRDRVVFVDLPGDGPASWRAAHRHHTPASSRIYAHFLVHEDTTAADDRRYMLAVQYIFFYPYNDGANNHEGDWEHINVLITTLASARDTTVDSTRLGALDSVGIGAILDGRIPLDSLVIGVVDYYFHHNVLTVGYHLTGLYPQGGTAKPARRGPSPSRIWEDPGYARSVVNERMRRYGGAFATHPIGYIGGNNKGPDELIHIVPRFLRSYNRNTGATYPFPGTWETVGPLRATENVGGTIVPGIIRDTVAEADGRTRVRARATGDHYLNYTSSDIELLPDWELLLPLIRRDPAIRRQWAWLVLPIRWGYPATRSPGGGAVSHVDLGNLAPFGPAFKAWWNRIGETREHKPYTIRTLRTPISPRVPWSVLQSGWGFLNYPLVLSQIFPFYNMAGAHMSPGGVPAAGRLGLAFPKTFVASVDERIASIGFGGARSIGGADFARGLVAMAVAADPQFETLRHDPARAGAERLEIAQLNLPRVMLDLHIGNFYFVENSFSMGDAMVQYAVRDSAAGQDVRLAGRLELRQLTGGLRSLLPWTGRDDHQLFARLGAGWSWYKLHDITLDGAELAGARRGGYRPPIIPGHRSWPNFAYAGFTYEFFPPRRAWRYDWVGLGLRVDATYILQRFPSHDIDARHDLWRPRGELSVTGTIGW